MKKIALFTIVVFAFFVPDILAHPTGNLIVAGEHVLWSYVNPIDDPNHHACIMLWQKGSEPKPFITSEFEASDFMLYNRAETIYIIERRFIQRSLKFEIRILKTGVGEKPEQLWDWFEDRWRIGEGGFFMNNDDEIVFGSYPSIFKLKKGSEPTIYFDIGKVIKSVRFISENELLLLGDDKCWLTDNRGKIIQQWENLTPDSVQNAPLNRNQIFDADYQNGELLLAYWGNRSFDLIDVEGRRSRIVQQQEPLAPHWVAFFGEKKLLFSSKIVFDGSNPKPHFEMFLPDSHLVNIWTKP
ncbi:MAG: hypothetical protein H6629_05695 [Calditrichae bacterium]|nr:hypothetical protein [Calditrichia bacterium]